MFLCPACHSSGLEYDQEAVRWVCKDCGYEEVIVPKEKFCPKCRHKYKEITWFIPSGCLHCGYSFVD